MKKALSLVLAVMLIFSCMAVGASAATVLNQNPGPDWFGDPGSGKPATYEQVILAFDTNGATLTGGFEVYDVNTGNRVPYNDIQGVWARVPSTANDAKPGSYITFPSATPQAGDQVIGWYCEEDGQTYAMSSQKIPETINGQSTAGTVLHFQLHVRPAAQEEDTIGKVLGVLAKVFGAIIGVLLYKGDTEAGVALVTKMLEGIMG